MATGGVGEAMLISAITGAGTSAVMGGDPLKGALLGAATGGIGHGVAGATAAGEAANVASQAANSGIGAMTDTAGFGLDAASTIAPNQAVTSGGANISNIASGMAGDPANAITSAGINTPTTSLVTPPPTPPSMFPRIAEMSKSGYFYPGLGVAASFIGDRPVSNIPGAEDYSGPLSRFSYDPDRYRPFRAASGGLMDTAPARRMAAGGLGSYSDGGQMLKGPGDGMSDDIPASIGDTQPARLADGEFVIPADVVSGLGNGSTEAGARELYAMMDRVREARTGRERQAPEIDAEKYLPA